MKNAQIKRQLLFSKVTVLIYVYIYLHIDIYVDIDVYIYFLVVNDFFVPQISVQL